MKITILGHVCIDKNTSENSSYTAVGSPAMFMHKIFRQLPDNQVTIVAPYGQDFIEHKKEIEIYPKNPTGKMTLMYENITKNGIRKQKAHNRDSANPVPINNQVKKIIAMSDIIFIAPLTPHYSPEYLSKLLPVAGLKSLKVLIPQGYYRDFDKNDYVNIRSFYEAESILKLVDIVIVSDQDHADMMKLAKVWVNKYKIMVIITLGENGAVAIAPDQEIHLPTRAVPEHEVVDSVGSGDIFSAGFAYRYHHTRNLMEAGRFANELARQCLYYTPDEIKITYQELI
jgi:hypothetical protein